MSKKIKLKRVVIMDLNKTNKRKDMAKKIRPLLVLLILVPIVSFMMYPMMNMSPKDLHVGIVNLDRGAEFDQGKVNLGNKIVGNITNPEKDDDDSTEESPVIWEEFNSKGEAKKALANEKIYAYLVIPKDFSESQTQQLEAFNTLGEALGKMSEGTGKMSEGIGQAGGKLAQLPKAFKTLAEATSGLGNAAKAGQAILTNTSNAINENAGNIADNDAAVNEQINIISQRLTNLESKVEDGTATADDNWCFCKFWNSN